MNWARTAAALWPPSLDAQARLPFTGHLAELRRRLIVCLFAVAVGTVLCWSWLGSLYALLMRPLGTVTLVALGPGEGLATDLRLAVTGGIGLALPTLLTQIGLFVQPAIGVAGRRRVISAIAAALTLMAAGAFAGYELVLPAALRFLLTRGAQPPQMLSVARYAAFALASILTTALIALIPLVLLALAALGVISADTLRRHRRRGWLALIIGAAFLTPSTDAVTLLLLVGPLLLLYEATLLVMKAVRA